MEFFKFEDLQLDQEFVYNGNVYIKRSTRTALLIEFNRVFYFGKKDRCTVFV